jgi:hypothetical protein
VAEARQAPDPGESARRAASEEAQLRAVSDLVFDANAVAEVVTYVAPGFLARLGYRARYPTTDAPAGEVVVVSVVASLPLVALVSAALPGRQDATQAGYVLLLLAVAFAVGYGVAWLRGTKRVRKLLRVVDYHYDPEGTIYAQTLKHMSPEGTVLVELKDGRRIWGCPRSGPQRKDDGVNELYLVYPQAEDDDGKWHDVGAGVIIPLAEVSNLALSEEPTGI